MAVKKSDRKVARQLPLQKARPLLQQVLILTRSPEFLQDEQRWTKGGILGSGQAYDAYGRVLLNYAQKAYYNCYEASKVYVKTHKTYKESEQYLRAAIACYRYMLAHLDFCYYYYGTSIKKQKSIKHLIFLTNDAMNAAATRIELNKHFIK